MLGSLNILSVNLPGIAPIAISGYELITTASDSYTQNI